MGRHDTFGHEMHVTKRQKFTQTKPNNAIVDQTTSAPQQAPKGSNANNQYR